MSEKKAVIFDLDGTLLDTLADLCDSVNRMLSHFGFPLHTCAEVKGMVGNGARRLAFNAIPDGEKNERAEECADYLIKNYHDPSSVKAKPYPGVVELLDTLRAHGIKLAVVSNKLHAVSCELCERFFGGRIDIVLGDKEGIRKKPYPDGVLYVMDKLGCDRGVFVGDGDADIAVAKNAGIESVSVSWGFRDREFLTAHGAEVIVDDADGLARELGRLLGEDLGKIKPAE